MNLDRRLVFGFDWLWLIALLGLVFAGLVAIWSSTPGTGLDSYFGKQILFLGIGLFLTAVVLLIDYHFVSDHIAILYGLGIAALVSVLVAGKTVHSSRSWLGVGPLVFQPSELMKLLVIVGLAKVYAEIDRDYLEFNHLILGGLIVGIPTVLVVLQGDLGTAVTFLPVFLGITFLAGLRRKYFVAMLILALVMVPAGWLMLQDYQKGRIQSVLDPASDPLHMGYQTIQSKIAVGSGKLLGRGFKQGSQSQLGFLPARHTDFVFAVVAEERGFLGSLAVLSLFLFVCVRLIRTAREAKDRIGALICVGVLSMFLFHIMINVGMVLGLLPIAGIPLPFVSAGGSSLISSFLAMALAMNIRMRRYVN